MILLALGANLPTDRFGPPERALQAALGRLSAAGITVVARSRWYRSAPVPPSDQPWYTNGVARIATDLAPRALMAQLLGVESAFGRRRTEPLAPRVLDLDLIDYDGRIESRAAGPDGPALDLPHPRLAERSFVLHPLREVAPDWRHPVTGYDLANLIAALPQGQTIVPIEDGPP